MSSGLGSGFVSIPGTSPVFQGPRRDIRSIMQSAGVEAEVDNTLRQRVGQVGDFLGGDLKLAPVVLVAGNVRPLQPLLGRLDTLVDLAVDREEPRVQLKQDHATCLDLAIRLGGGIEASF